MSQYSGANWVKSVFKCDMSPLGEAVADLLGDVFLGIYHLDEKALKRVDWSNTYYIEFCFGDRKELCTWDYDELTRLMVLAHDRMIRVSIEPRNFRCLTLRFHQRNSRTGPIDTRYPTLEDHTKIIRDHYKAAEE